MADCRDDILYDIAFSSYRNINVATARRFAALGISPCDFFGKSAGTLAALSGIKASYFDDGRRAEAVEAARAETAFVRDNGIKVLRYTDDAYPQRLGECNDAPAVLYAMGDAGRASARHSVAIVGTRHGTAYGADFTRRLVADLASALDDVLVVSGLAFGIDIAAHRAALDAGVATAAVLAHGFNTIYPADHRNEAREIARGGGFLATEYRSCDTIHRGNFLARNRLIAGLADVTVVVESDVKGGAMVTARLASAYNREVMALPGRVNDPYSRGCLELIAHDTARMVRDASDLIEVMGWTRKPAVGEQAELKFEIPAHYAEIIELIRQNPDMTVNDMCVALGMPYARLSSLLFEMEMDDYIISVPGGRYTLPASAR